MNAPRTPIDRTAPDASGAEAAASLVDLLDGFFRARAPLDPGDTLVVAFSGGPDSAALLSGLAALAPRRGFGLLAVHVDHGLDPGSAGRAERARLLAGALSVPLAVRPVSVPARRQPGESLEVAARRLRYEVLEDERHRAGARWIATAHHRDDQVETVLLRLLFGSGLGGLRGIPDRRGRIVRPALGLDRRALRAALPAGLPAPADDPGNRDLRVPRNRARTLLLPALEVVDPSLPGRLLAAGQAASRAARRIDGLLARRLEIRATAGGACLLRAPLEGLPEPLWPAALALLHRLAGLPYPPRSRAVRELRRQVLGGGAVACHCDAVWRWRGCGPRIEVERHAISPPAITYTLQVPGAVDIPELALRFHLAPGSLAPWMFAPSRRRAGLALDLEPGRRVTIRNRRAGDRIRPFGLGRERRLKEVLIDGRVPRAQRDRLPLLVIDDRLVWVPGVALAESARVRPGRPLWVAEVEELPGAGIPAGPRPLSAAGAGVSEHPERVSPPRDDPRGPASDREAVR